MRLLERFCECVIRIILNIRLSDFVTNVEIQEQVDILSIEAMLLKYHLRRVGHVSRMEDFHLPRITLSGDLSTDHRENGAPTKCYKDCLKKSNAAYLFGPVCLSDLAVDRVA